MRDSDFFSYYRLNLYNKECPFWSDEGGLCGNIACAVNTLENEEDIPLSWRADELGKLEGPHAQHPNRKMQREPKPLMGGLGDEVGESCVVEYDDECDDRDYCVPEDESATAKGDYVSLVDNPERFTGYSGPSAHQVWEAIYRENCFPRDHSDVESASPPSSKPLQASADLRNVIREHERHESLVGGISSPTGSDLENDLPEPEQCLEKRVFYRIISGMHASISTHLCYEYLNKNTGSWEPNATCYADRLHNYPDRISNLYFNYALVLRAVEKLRPTLDRYTFCSGDMAQDRLTKDKIVSLADQISQGPQIYDESGMFRDQAMLDLKDDFRNRFRNVSRTMDCVGCDKCRLWGKLQTAGYGTALKVLFEYGNESTSATGGNGDDEPLLKRTELVALVNTLDKLSHAIKAVGEFEKMIENGEGAMGGSSAPSLMPSLPGTSNKREAQSPSTPVDLPSTNTDTAVLDTTEDTTDPDFYPPSTPDSHSHPQPSAFDSEFQLIWQTTTFVLRSWIAFPSKLLNIIVLQLSSWWDFYVGRSRDWKWVGVEMQWAPGVGGNRGGAGRRNAVAEVRGEL